MKTWGPILFLLIGWALIPIVWKYNRKRSRRLLEEWAFENGFDIIDTDNFANFESPFRGWTTSRRQVVCQVTVRNKRGVFLSGWVRFGSYWGGVSSSKQVEVKWDNPSLLDL